MANQNYMFVRDLDGCPGRMLLDGDGNPSGLREVMRPDGSWTPYYIDGSEIDSTMVAEVARRRYGLKDADPFGPTVYDTQPVGGAEDG